MSELLNPSCALNILVALLWSLATHSALVGETLCLH